MLNHVEASFQGMAAQRLAVAAPAGQEAQSTAETPKKQRLNVQLTCQRAADKRTTALHKVNVKIKALKQEGEGRKTR
jgi:hypothetical protein